jgi:hypothetical protein
MISKSLKTLSVWSGAFLLALWDPIDGLCQQAVPGTYLPDSNGVYQLYTGTGDQFWPGTWNTSKSGYQDKLDVLAPGTSNPWAVVYVGSRVMNSWGDYYSPAHGKRLRIELLDAQGVLVPLRDGKAIESNLPQRISVHDLGAGVGVPLSKQSIYWFTNGSPARLYEIELRDMFLIRTEGDYTLSICPIVYKMELDKKHLSQIALPFLRTNIHLLKDVRPETGSSYGSILINTLKCVAVLGGVLWIAFYRTASRRNNLKACVETQKPRL